MQNQKISKVIGLVLLVLLFSTAWADDTTSNDPVQVHFDIESLQAGIDTLGDQIEALQGRIESAQVQQREEQIERELEQNQANLDAFLAKQKSEEKRQHKRVIVRGVALGVALLALVVGRIRRKKQTT